MTDETDEKKDEKEPIRVFQFRKDRGQGKWYAPDRDMVYAFPRMMSRAIHSLGENWDDIDLEAEAKKRGMENIDAALLCSFAVKLREFFKKTSAKVDDEEAIALMTGLLAPEHVQERVLVADLVFQHILAEYPIWAWIAGAKSAGDVEIDASEVDNSVQALLDAARP